MFAAFSTCPSLRARPPIFLRSVSPTCFTCVKRPRISGPTRHTSRTVVMQTTGDRWNSPGSGDYAGYSEGSPIPAEVEAQVRELDTDEIKRELLNCVNGSNRGLSATPLLVETALGLISQLEKRDRAWRSPSTQSDEGRKSSDSDILVGTWRLVFTNALDILSLGLIPFVTIGRIFQNVETGSSPGRYTLYNEVELLPPFTSIATAFGVGASVSRVQVTAEGTAAGADSSRIDIRFVKSRIEGISLLGFDTSKLPKFEVPVNSAVGYVDTTYIDDEMRIARAPPSPNAPNVSNYFVLLRE